MTHLELVGCTVDLRSGIANPPQGEPVRLTTREVALLTYLAERPGELVTRTELLTRVWGYAPTVASRAADNTMRRLRTKLERDPSTPEHLLTVHGEGYRFEPLRHREETPIPVATRGILRFETAVVDLDRLKVYRDSEAIPLTGQEADLLALLGQRDQVPRDELARAIWSEGAERALDGALQRLRRKLGEGILESARGRGVSLVGRLDDGPRDPDFIGRSAELGQVRATLARGVGLIALVGPAGVGKTELARRVEPDAFWVDLAHAGDGEEGVLDAICLQVGVPPRGARTRRIERLVRVLSRRPLLVLDNCELAIDALRSLVPPLLEGGVRVLATSRIRLGLRAEHPIPIRRLRTSDAIRLYVRRVTQAMAGRDPGFQRIRVAALVEALEGIPLAIELAAAQASLLPPDRLVDRLQLDVLQGSSGRFDSMRAAIQVSWDALDPADQQALAVLSRLPGGFSLELAERILGPPAVVHLRAFHDAHLVRSVGAGRLAPFHSVREFAREQPVTEDQLASLLGALAVLGDPEFLARVTHRDHLDRGRELEDELQNLLAVLPLAVEHAPEHAVRLALAAAQVLKVRGPMSVGVRTTGQVLHVAREGLEAAELYRARASFLRYSGNWDSAVVAAERCLELAPEGSLTRAYALALFAVRDTDGSRYDASVPRYLEAAEAFEVAGHGALGALCRCRAEFYGQRRLDLAIAHGERAIGLADQTGDVLTYAVSADFVAKLCWLAWKLGAALAYSKEAEAAQVQLGRNDVGAFASMNHIQMRLASGEHEGLLDELDRCTTTWQQMGHVTSEGLMFALRGHYHSCRGEHDRAVEPFARSRRILRGFEVLPRFWSMFMEALYWVRRGDLQTGESILLQAIDGLDACGTPEHQAVARCLHARIRAQRGDPDAARQRVDEAHPPIQDVVYPPSHIALATARGWLAWAEGDRDAALEALGLAEQIALRNGITSPVSPSTLDIADLRGAIEG